MRVGHITEGSLLVDIRCRGEIVRIATPILVARVLVYTNIVHAHSRREWQMVDIDETEVLRHSQVHDEVLRRMNTESIW